MESDPLKRCEQFAGFVEYGRWDFVAAVERNECHLRASGGEVVAEQLSDREWEQRVGATVRLQDWDPGELRVVRAPLGLGDERSGHLDERGGWRRPGERGVEREHRALREAAEHELGVVEGVATVQRGEEGGERGA